MSFREVPRYQYEHGRVEIRLCSILTKDHGWVDLTVCVRGAVAAFSLLEVIRNHGNHHSLLLKSVNVLDHPTGHQVLPAEVRDGQRSLSVATQELTY